MLMIQFRLRDCKLTARHTLQRDGQTLEVPPPSHAAFVAAASVAVYHLITFIGTYSITLDAYLQNALVAEPVTYEVQTRVTIAQHAAEC